MHYTKNLKNLKTIKTFFFVFTEKTVNKNKALIPVLFRFKIHFEIANFVFLTTLLFTKNSL